MLIAALLGRPSENVKGEVRVGLGSEGFVHVGGSKPGFEILDPCLELFLQWGLGPGVGVGFCIWVLGSWWRWG